MALISKKSLMVAAIAVVQVNADEAAGGAAGGADGRGNHIKTKANAQGEIISKIKQWEIISKMVNLNCNTCT
jgi:hypothetical protein